MSELVKQVLEHSAISSSGYLSTQVNKDISPDIDMGNLMIVDQEPIDLTKLRDSKEVYLHNIARDNTQLLINKIWELPVERIDNIIVAKLPKPTTSIPREKPIPKTKEPTKWEKYAKLKGIQNKKKGRMKWDKTAKEWRPAWGYQRVNNPSEDWVLEVPDNSNPYEDQFEKRITEKQEKVSKNELQRLRNIARSQKKKVPGVGITPVEKPSKSQLTKALGVAKASTPSLGKFSEKVAKEPNVSSGKKRKFETVTGNMDMEKQRQLDILERSLKKQSKLNVTAATNIQIMKEDKARKLNKVKHKKGTSSGKRKGGDKGKAANSSTGSSRGGGKGKKGGRNKFNPNKVKSKRLGKKK